MGWHEHNVIDPQILTGKPIIKGTRIAVEFIVELLSQGWSVEEIAHNHALSLADIRAALHYATDVLKHERVSVHLNSRASKEND